MEPVVLVRYSEIAVKGRHTRPRLEKMLASHIKEAIERNGLEGLVERQQGRIIVRRPTDAIAASKAAARVFGVKSTSPAIAVKFSSLEDLVGKATNYFAERVRGKKFRVTARRSGTHDFTSLDVERLVGSRLLASTNASVDLKDPEYIAYIEIREQTAYFYDTIIKGPGGLPLGSEEPTLVLYSGGFDSTAAAWLVMRRGSPADLVYFDVGAKEALENAVETARLMAREWVYGRRLKMYIIDFKDATRVVASSVRPKYRVLVLRRLMLVEAQKLALNNGYEALVTGESIGQVATQTVRNMRLIGSSMELPVIRPVSGMDKDDVMRLVRDIGLYESVSRQVETCSLGIDPTPRGDPAIFREELDKATGKYRVATSIVEIGG